VSAAQLLDTVSAGNIQFRAVYKKRSYADGESSRVDHLNCIELKTFHRQFCIAATRGLAACKLCLSVRHAGCLRTAVLLYWNGERLNDWVLRRDDAWGKPSGYCTLLSTILRPAHTVYLCVLCGSEKKRRLFTYTGLTDWFL
jgi:hypothetical protein